MSTRDELARIVDEVRDDPARRDMSRIIEREHSMARFQGFGEWDQARLVAHKLHAAGYRKPRTIETAVELDALRFQAVVLDAYGTPYVCERHATDLSRNEWRPAGMSHLEESEGILYHGPATVVHEGEPKP